MDDLEPDLAEIQAEGRRLGPPGITSYLQHNEHGKCIVFQIVADDAVEATRLKNALYEFCDARGYLRRFIIVRTTVPAFTSKPRMPDHWPPA